MPQNESPVRVVIDTSVWVSSLLWEGPKVRHTS
jgi:predicted nucleic acid-binding protein